MGEAAADGRAVRVRAGRFGLDAADGVASVAARPKAMEFAFPIPHGKNRLWPSRC